MSIEKKVAYLKGYIEGVRKDLSKQESEIFDLFTEILDEMSTELSLTQDSVDEIYELCDDIDYDLGELEKDVYDIDDEDDDDDDCCNCESCTCHDDDDCCCDEEDDDLYEVICSGCGETICVDGDILESGEINCPNCNEKITFDLEFLNDEIEDTDK